MRQFGIITSAAELYHFYSSILKRNGILLSVLVLLANLKPCQMSRTIVQNHFAISQVKVAHLPLPSSFAYQNFYCNCEHDDRSKGFLNKLYSQPFIITARSTGLDRSNTTIAGSSSTRGTDKYPASWSQYVSYLYIRIGIQTRLP
jgi:hypothetical protein